MQAISSSMFEERKGSLQFRFSQNIEEMMINSFPVQVGDCSTKNKKTNSLKNSFWSLGLMGGGVFKLKLINFRSLSKTY